MDNVTCLMDRGLASFDIYVIVSELQNLIGCYVEKIYQLSRNEILLKVQQKIKNQKKSIFIRNGELICLTSKQFEAPEKPSLFAMTLRKYLINGKISEIIQHEFDRIIKIKIGKKEGDYTLICELFSHGNIILCNPEGKIIRPLVKQEWAARLIKSGEIYKHPPSQTNPFFISEQDFKELLTKSKKDLIRTLATSINLSGLYAEEICVRAGINKNTKITELTNTSIKKVYDELEKFLMVFQEKKFQPMFVKKDNIAVDILPIPFFSYVDIEYEPTISYAQGLDLFIKIKKIKKIQDTKYHNHIEKLKRQREQQKQSIDEFKINIAQKKLEADLIYLNFQACEKILQEITILLRQKEKTNDINKIQQNPLVEQFDPIANELILKLNDGKGVTVPVDLDFRKSVTKNAEQKYEESKKLQDKLKGAQDAILQTNHELETMKKPESIEEKKQTKKEKLMWFERFRWFISTEGNIIIAGKDASSNDLVVKKYLSEGDRYAHADIHGAPSCVVKNKGVNDEKLPISEKTLEEACQFAASYSRAWNQFGETSAYWVLPEQVSKTPESGEFVPKGAFIIRGKRNYHRCSLEIAVGLVRLGEIEKLMGGPINAVASRTANKYVILVPGITKKTLIAQQLAKIFNVSIETVEKVLPPGNLIIKKTIGYKISLEE